MCSNMNEPRDSLSKWNKSKDKRERQKLYDIIYMCNLKKLLQMNLQNRNRLTTLKINLCLVSKGDCRGQEKR